MRVFAVLVGVLAVLVGSLALGVPASATASEQAVATAPVLTQQTQDPGPKLDPQTEADAKKTKNKIIVGGAAAVLLVIVLWGRHVRAKRSKAKK